MRLFVSIAMLIVATLVPFGAQARTIQISDIRRTISVSSPKISPDGMKIVCVVTRSDYENNAYKSDVLLIDIASGGQRVLTRGRQDVMAPQWSPTGDRIAFVARESESDGAQDQLYVMPMNGGDAKKITNAPNGVDVFAWKPDGSALAYVTENEPWNKDAIVQGHDYFEVGNDPYLTTAAPSPLHLWVVSADGGTARRITSGSWSIAAPDTSVPLSWSPDGREIVLTRVPTPHTGDGDQSTIVVVDVTTKQVRKLTSQPRFEDYASFSPDGTKIAYWYSLHGDDMHEGNVFVAPAHGGEGVNVQQIDRDVNGALWMPDSKTLLIGAPDGTRTSLWLQPLAGPARKLDLGAIDPSNDSNIDMTVGKDGAIAFSGYTHTQPTELYYLSSALAPPRRLTDFNHDTALLDLGPSQTITWKTFDGMTADGVLTYPPGYVKGKRYPLVLDIHGGPNEGSNADFYDLIQIIAARGYLVFQPNYRGGDNLGDAFMYATWNDGGEGPGRDIMAGLAAVEKLGIADASRIGLGGWSNGGYMTSWLIGHYQVWKAAVLGAAYTTCIDDYNLSDSNVSDRWYFKGSPWVGDHMAACREQSPITYWKNMKTPTLILSNTGDVRVPITQSYSVFHALRDNHVPVKFVAWPESGHEVSGPVRVEDMYRLWIDWYDHYLR